MDRPSSDLVLILISAALAAIAVAMAAFRRKRPLYIYAAGYACAALGFALLLGQGRLWPLVSVSLANTLNIGFQFCLAWGLRAWMEQPRPWPRRFHVYLGLCVLAQVVFIGAAVPRAAAGALFAMLLSGEFLYALESGRRKVAPFMRMASRVIALAYMAGFLLRLAMVLGLDHGGSGPGEQGLGGYEVGLLAFFSVLWGGLVLGIDIAGLLDELERKNRSLSDMATTDNLTGLANRHQLDATVLGEIERASRYHEPLSLVLLDLDYFKRVNDTWGHATGDEVLVRAARLSQEMIRDTDRIFRWGGEEFLILTPHTNLEGAVVLAEKLRAALASEKHPKVGRLTASLGVTEWGEGEGQAELLRRVDRALYRAKTLGRNRVASLAPGEAPPLSIVRLDFHEEWESGDTRIDGEHRELLALVQEFLDRSVTALSSAEIVPYFERFFEHLVKHFADEEATLTALGYPGAAEHAAIHKGLIRSAEDQRSRLERGELGRAEFSRYLVDTIVLGHLQVEDIKFFPWTKEADAGPPPSGR
ncbi:MAG TPA: diguanylate cyclase [Rectinemataceae bacterium]|nr:diguanylate cyclase [Rectinemataceae bacterium]